MVFLALSSACRLVMVRRFSQFPVVSLVLRLPSMRPYARPLFGFLAVPLFLPSGFRQCVLSFPLGFYVSLPVDSSWSPLARFSWCCSFLL